MNEEWTDYPRLISVESLPEHHLLCRFDNGDIRRYDFRRHLGLDMFQLLRDPAYFRAVRADPHGLGAVWNDDMDIAASELWLNGIPLSDPRPVTYQAAHQESAFVREAPPASAKL